jgi:copper(I)-binding protein
MMMRPVRPWHKHSGAWSLIAAGAQLALLFFGPAAAQEFKIGAVVVERPWTRATPGGAKVAGGYLTVRNTGNEPDRLIGGSLAQAGRFEIHESRLEGDVARMRHLPGGLEIKPGQSVTLAPGGYHVMFMGLKAPLKQGDKIKGQLIFQKAGTVEVEYAVEGVGAKSSGHGH